MWLFYVYLLLVVILAAVIAVLKLQKVQNKTTSYIGLGLWILGGCFSVIVLSRPLWIGIWADELTLEKAVLGTIFVIILVSCALSYPVNHFWKMIKKK